MTPTSILVSSLAVAVVLAAGLIILWPAAQVAVQAPLSAIGITSDHEKLGWMDDADYTEGDRQRVAQIAGRQQGSNLSVIRSIQAGARGSVTRRDFELMRQDRRRAQAAYPDVKADDLFEGGWISVDMSARIPSDWCTSGNSNGTQGHDGKWYLDGGCHVSFVRSKYSNRADAATTTRVLADLKDGKRKKRLAHTERWGYSTWWSGTGGSGSVNCYPDSLPSSEEADDRHIAGQCVIVLGGQTKYVFPFVATDWVDPPWSKDGLEKLALSKGAQPIAYVAPPAKPWTIKDGLLARGQTGTPGRLYWSHFNSDKDDYDNEDIGPDTPESWVLERPFGIAYLPAPGNGERRSVSGKPWFLIASYYGFASQASGGWDEDECKAALPRLLTGMSFPMAGQDYEQMNRGNLKEARCTQAAPAASALLLADRSLPVKPTATPEPSACVQGGTLMPGQTCVARF